MIDEENSQPIKDLSPGKMLLQGRLEAGLTQEQVAQELYMTVYKVKALEADDYNRLNSDTFARGYIRAYANLVKVDLTAVLAAYDALMDELNPPILMPPPVATEQNHHRSAWLFLVIIGAFFVGLWLISVWFFDNHNEPQYPAAITNVSSAASLQKSVSTAPSSKLLNTTTTNTEVISRPVVNADDKAKTTTTSQTITSTQRAISMPQSIPGDGTLKKVNLDELNLTFRAESWLEVSDSRGDVLATELEPASSKIKLLGVAPFDVKLGNAPAVDIQLNGKKIDVVPLIGTNVLTLKIRN